VEGRGEGREEGRGEGGGNLTDGEGSDDGGDDGGLSSSSSSSMCGGLLLDVRRPPPPRCGAGRAWGWASAAAWRGGSGVQRGRRRRGGSGVLGFVRLSGKRMIGEREGDRHTRAVKSPL
jgi:hypothetical protein